MGYSASTSPSLSPSVSPSVSTSPSESPSVSPSISQSPSVSPSKSPSVSPSVSPSLSPSVSSSPSLSPSVSPSLSTSPSVSPSKSPSVSPSLSTSPSLSPSVSPSLSTSPSESPSISPSISQSPSVSPSKSPSISSSISSSLSTSPSISPSVSPSVSPSESPSTSPSSSVSPSVSPSLSTSPSVSPSVSSSLSASPSISQSPSLSPSVSPSVSKSPSLSPSVSPSLSTSPSVSPSVSPSLSPSASPSLSTSPSVSPSASPSISPSASPSKSPSASSSVSSSPSPSAASPVIPGPRLPLHLRITNPWFLEQDADGRPAAGYRVYTLAAGTIATLVDTYSDRLLTVVNTNPIVLNQYGEAVIFTSVDLKLVYTSPTGDLTSPIWTEDYVATQQSVVSDNGYGVYAGNNKYAVDIVPPYINIPGGFSLVMLPDTSSLDTLVTPAGAARPTVFTGTGINDGAFSGRYIGSTAGAIFSATIDTSFVEDPATAPTAAVSATVGTTPPTAGVHLVAITYVTAEGETLIGPTVSVTANGTHKIDVAAIPVGPTGKGITGRRIYMTEAAGTDFYYVDEIADIVTVVYKIDLTDVTLAGNNAAPIVNGTGNGTGADTFSWQIDGGAATDGVPISSVGPQTLQDGLFIEFSNIAGHTLGDVWTVEVMTPVTLNFCDLGSKLVYKGEGGKLVVLDAYDIITDYPAHLDYSLAEDCWILINPSLPILELLIPLRRRKEVTSDYTVNADNDQGIEINATGTLTLTLPDCIDAVSHFFYLRNGSTGVVTIDAGIYTIKGPNTSTMLLGPGIAVQLATNGVDWHILTTSESVPVGTISMFGGATAPIGYLLCDGTAVSRTTYKGLFDTIGEVFGVGDGTTTFNVPDMTAKFPVGAGVVGATGGAASTSGVLGAAVVNTAIPDALGINLDTVAGNFVGTGWRVGVDNIAASSGLPPFLTVNFIIKY
jgi:hypothetical protein